MKFLIFLIVFLARVFCFCHAEDWVDDCEKCSVKSCLKCNENYYLDNTTYPLNKCKRCPDNCEVCVTREFEHSVKNFYEEKDITWGCIMCKEGYFLEKENEQSDVRTCKECGGCDICDQTSNTFCTQCNFGGFYKEIINGNLRCPKCEIANCLDCTSQSDTGDACFECKDGYYMTDEGKCNSCNGCSMCNSNTKPLCDNTIPCDEGYYLSNNGNSILGCTKCTQANCKTCEKSTNNPIIDTCNECKDGFYMISMDGKLTCSECFVENCKKCENNLCTECHEGYFADKQDGYIMSCILCTVKYCLTCPKNVCTQCKENFYPVDDVPITECKSIYDEDFGSNLFIGIVLIIAIFTLL